MTQKWIQDLIYAFIPLFVAIDPIGLIPVFLAISKNIESRRLNFIVRQATLTAAIIAVLFVFLGRLIFMYLGITVADFQVAGGLILLALASKELLGGNHPSNIPRDIGIVPLGVPLIAGPAAITTLLILIDSVGIGPTITALTLNLILVYLAFHYSSLLKKLVGIAGLRAISKIIALLLAAIAVHMIRHGIQIS